ncbi:hypothetical protein [Alicyclobacillus vulcanalis]|uniref:Uncharacterized protein n=1 Tax=Alicyclobacillus vulcanalis TaxID=252246 RepID=A0A1N7JZS1_9BACL|nr:hypothetical protein [Alicyclobacillus vulcanalis]SIS54839.1 hypothetical protein SAMN05421799_101268 [Alicyclobacillus vulcanalis]
MRMTKKRWAALSISAAFCAAAFSAWQVEKALIKAHEFQVAERVVGPLERLMAEDTSSTDASNAAGKSPLSTLDRKTLEDLRHQVLDMRTLSSHGTRVQEDLLKVVDMEDAFADQHLIDMVRALFSIRGTLKDLNDHLYIETGRSLDLSE